MMGKYVQYGCGYSAPDGWINYDSSPSLRLLRTPLIGSLLYRASRNPLVFPAAVKSGNIVKGLPEGQETCDGIYASHVLEHLSRSDCLIALEHTYSLLKPGALFRVIVPDLESRARRYILDLDHGRKDANDRFLQACYMGSEVRRRGFIARLRQMYGASEHLWMYDVPSMTDRLEAVGFTEVRRCVYGDSADPMFAAVEDPSRFHDEVLDAPEVALEARRPFDGAS